MSSSKNVIVHEHVYTDVAVVVPKTLYCLYVHVSDYVFYINYDSTLKNLVSYANPLGGHTRDMIALVII